MPLKEGSSKGTIATNIEHCMSVYKKTGKVSGNPVASAEKASKICAAMAYSSAKKSSTQKSLLNKLKEK